MKLSLLIKLAVMAAQRFAPGAVAASAAFPELVANLLRDLRAHVPPVTHDDGTPIPLEELDALVDARAVAAHLAVHAGDRDADPDPGDSQQP